MVQTVHAAPGAVLVRTLPQVARVKSAGEIVGRDTERQQLLHLVLHFSKIELEPITKDS